MLEIKNLFHGRHHKPTFHLCFFSPFTQLFLFPFTQLFLVPFTQLPAEFFVSIEAVAFGFLVLSALDTLYAHWGQFF